MQNQKILIIGSGGREYAIGWKLAQSPRTPELYFAPGNAGTSIIGNNVDIKATDIQALLEFTKSENIYMTLALPDDPLALGIVNIFRENNLRIWGPTKEASKLEWSKAYAKDFMKRHNLPTAKFEIFTDEEYDDAIVYVESHTMPVVVKASGLALGKGVVICNTINEAKKAVEDILVKKIHGDGGNEIVIEEFLTGPEISVHAFSDGVSCKLLPISADHKRIGEGNTGPNTGGMGTIAPVSFVDEAMIAEIKNKIVLPTLVNMEHEGNPFEGLLYPGLILTKDGPKIIEFNSRFGDPETQTYMRLLDTDLLEIFEACLDKKLSELEIKWKEGYACNIVLASGGYPGEYEKGKVIEGVLNSPRQVYPKGEVDKSEMQSTPSLRTTPQEGNNSDIVIFHAGTKLNSEGNLVTNGGRVLGVSATGATLDEALQKAYSTIEKISFKGMQYRRDIGKTF